MALYEGSRRIIYEKGDYGGYVGDWVDQEVFD
jgi:hypothetical protein